MSSSRLTNSISIADIIADRYRSVRGTIAALTIALWIALCAFALTTLYREVTGGLSSWIVDNKAKLEEAVYLRNFAPIGLRLSHLSELSSGVVNYEVGVFDPSRERLWGELDFPPILKSGLRYEPLKLRIYYFEPLMFGGRPVGFLFLSGQLKPLVWAGIVAGLFVICLLVFWFLRLAMRSFIRAMDRRLAAPVRRLHDTMAEASLHTGVLRKISPPPEAAIEVADLYESYSRLLERIKDASELEIKRAHAESGFRLAAQVAHDIRSPLSVLSTVSEALEGTEEKRRMMTMAIQRINEIAENLLNKYSPPSALPSNEEKRVAEPEPLLALTREMIDEKRLQYLDRRGVRLELQVEEGGYVACARVQASEYKRVLSNLINNAYEALGENGSVRLLVRRKDTIEVEVVDDGKGIPTHLLPTLTEQGVTYGKPGGSGLGLYHAKTSIEAWGGTLSISSTEGKGTRVRIQLPLTEKVSWLPAFIPIHVASLIVVDDDPSVAEWWRDRLVQERRTTKLQAFSSCAELSRWAEKNSLEGSVLLVDHEFRGNPESGLAFLERVKLTRQAILVTPAHHLGGLRRRCQEIGLPLLPKVLIRYVPFA